MCYHKKIVPVTVVLLLLFTFSTFAYGLPSDSLLKQDTLLKSAAPRLLPFNDVSGHWGEAFIAEMYLRGIMNGYADNNFRPNKPVTQLESLVMIVRMLGYDPEEYKQENLYLLKDVFKVPDWAIPYVNYALENDIVFYKELEKMTLQQPLVRQDAAIYIVRALGWTESAEKNFDPVDFTDANKLTDQARGYVAVATGKGILTGSSKGAFLPTNPMSRAETAAMLSRAFFYAPGQDGFSEYQGTIKTATRVDQAYNITITNNQGNTQTEQDVTLPQSCMIYRNNVAATLDSLIAGDSVKIIIKETDNGPGLVLATAQQISQGEISFEKVNLQNAPEKLKTLVESLKLQPGSYAFTNGKDLYLLACRGEKMNSGYTIEISSLIPTKEFKNILMATYSTSDPAKDQFYLPCITYPISLIKCTPATLPTKVQFKDKLTGQATEINVKQL